MHLLTIKLARIRATLSQIRIHMYLCFSKCVDWPGLGLHCHRFVSVCTCVFQRRVDWPGLGPHCHGFVSVFTCVYATALECTGFTLDCTGFNSCLWSCRCDCTGIGIYCPGMEKYYSLKLLSSFETAFICFICIILSLLGRGLFDRRSFGLIFKFYISLHNFVCTRQRPIWY